MDKSCEEGKSTDDYLKELSRIVSSLGDDHSKKRDLEKFLRSKNKSREFIDRYLWFHKMSANILSIHIEGHDPSIASIVKMLIYDGEEATLKYIK